MKLGPTRKCKQNVWAFPGVAPSRANLLIRRVALQQHTRMWRRPLRGSLLFIGMQADPEDPKRSTFATSGRLFSTLDNDTLKHQPGTVLGAAVLVAGTPSCRSYAADGQIHHPPHSAYTSCLEDWFTDRHDSGGRDLGTPVHNTGGRLRAFDSSPWRRVCLLGDDRPPAGRSQYQSDV